MQRRVPVRPAADDRVNIVSAVASNRFFRPAESIMTVTGILRSPRSAARSPDLTRASCISVVDDVVTVTTTYQPDAEQPSFKHSNTRPISQPGP